MSSFEKFSNRFFEFEKNSQNLKFFLLERDLFHEIDQIFGQDVGISGWNVMSDTPVREFRRLEGDRKILFPDPKICQNPQNGLSQKWPQIGRSYLYGRDTAAFRFWGLKRKVFGIQPRSESDCPASLIFLRGPAARLYFPYDPLRRNRYAYSSYGG